MSAARGGEGWRCDVLIVGGGPVGLLLAALLGRGGCHDVHVLDARSDAAVPAGVDPRVYALSRASQRLLMRCDAWPPLAGGHAWPYRSMHVWDAASAYAQDRALIFDAAELGEPDLGHIVENARLEAALRTAALACPRVCVQGGTRIERLESDPDCVTVTTSGGEQLHARLVVGADGAHSSVRRLAGIDVLTRDYRQQAIVTHVCTEFPHCETAWQRFLPTGPVALLPLGDGRSSVVWSADRRLARSLLALDDQAFAAALTDATEGILGRISAPQPRRAFPLQLLHARRYTAPRLVLIGDAAHVVHPLAGQGVNLGLLDAAQLAQALQAGLDPGEQRPLRRYERSRKAENLAMMAALDALQRLFALTAWPLTSWRAATLGLVNRAAPVKRRLMRQALGV